MHSSAAENIVFMAIRGLVALAIVGVSLYCIGQGIHFFLLPHTEAEAIQVQVLGLRISATGLGAVIFGTGIAMCFVALRTTPRRLESRRTTDNPPPPNAPALQNSPPAAAPSIDSAEPATGRLPLRVIEESIVFAVPPIRQTEETIITRVPFDNF